MVLFSIIIQGLTVKPLVEKLLPAEKNMDVFRLCIASLSGVNVSSLDSVSITYVPVMATDERTHS